MKSWDARPASSVTAAQAQPEGLELAGQLLRFSDPAAPQAYVDERRGACALVYSAVSAPQAVMDELRDGRIPVGPDGAEVGWRRVTQAFAGRPKAPKFYLQFGEAGGFGVCAEINNDLRRRDQSPAAVVQLYSCRIGKDERLGNG